MKFIYILTIISIISVDAKTPCEELRDSGLANSETGMIGNFIPKCSADGFYEKMQCQGSTGYCWCVEPSGEEIPDTRKGPGQGIVDC